METSPGVEDLVLQVMADPIGFLERIMRRTETHLVHEGVIPESDTTPPEELLTAGLTNWVVRMLEDRPGNSTLLPGRGYDAAQESVTDDLIERNSMIAAALGACDCWGERSDCRFCYGDGAAGWLEPDPRLFRRYIYPAVLAFKRSSPSSRVIQPPDTQFRQRATIEKGTCDDGHVD